MVGVYSIHIHLFMFMYVYIYTFKSLYTRVFMGSHLKPQEPVVHTFFVAGGGPILWMAMLRTIRCWLQINLYEFPITVVNAVANDHSPKSLFGGIHGIHHFQTELQRKCKNIQVDTKQPPGPDAGGPCAAGSCKQDNKGTWRNFLFLPAFLMLVVGLVAQNLTFTLTL